MVLLGPMGSFCQTWLTGWSVPHFRLLIYCPSVHRIRDGVSGLLDVMRLWWNGCLADETCSSWKYLRFYPYSGNVCEGYHGSACGLYLSFALSVPEFCAV
jgi:hypothetical protein